MWQQQPAVPARLIHPRRLPSFTLVLTIIIITTIIITIIKTTIVVITIITTITRCFCSEAGTNSTGLSSGASSPQVALNIHPSNNQEITLIVMVTSSLKCRYSIGRSHCPPSERLQAHNISRSDFDTFLLLTFFTHSPIPLKLGLCTMNPLVNTTPVALTTIFSLFFLQM